MQGRKNKPGGREIRHVVKVRADEEQELVRRAESMSVTVSRLLLTAALGTIPEIRDAVAVGEVVGLRRQVDNLARLMRELGPDAQLQEAALAVRASCARIDNWLAAAG